MPNFTKKLYQFNPHHHVKIWLSNKPNIFMNIENQMRLIQMRETNPADPINLVHDSSLLSKKATEDLKRFCKEHRITPVDVNEFGKSLKSKNEKILYQFYKDEVTHLGDGGNLALASDILRWLSPVYTKGAYTDFDVPVDTTNLPPSISVETPILINIGSLKTGNKEIILSNNDFIAVVDPEAAKKDIEKVQDGIIGVLGKYTNDFIEKTEEEYGKDSFLNKYLISFMRNRSESIYISRSKNIFPEGQERSSLEVRKYINEVMTDSNKFLDFNKLIPEESHESVIQRLRDELQDQMGFFKWLFFRNEYYEIKNILEQPDDKLIDSLMKKERTLYLKSIVVCTTGPIAVAKFLFNGYVFNPELFKSNIQPYSFNHYDLKSAFQSQNSISMHESIFGMMSFLGAEEGKLNDSSWLETGEKLQKSRGEVLEDQKRDFETKLPEILAKTKNDINNHIKQLEDSLTGFWGLFFTHRKQEKIRALQEVLACFHDDVFDTEQFRIALTSTRLNKSEVYAGLFYSKTQEIIETLQQNCHKSIVFGLTTNRQIMLNNKAETKTEADTTIKTSDSEQEPYCSPGLKFFEEEKSLATPEPESVSNNFRLNQ